MVFLPMMFVNSLLVLLQTAPLPLPLPSVDGVDLAKGPWFTQVIIQLLLLAAAVAGFAYNIYLRKIDIAQQERSRQADREREERNRKWDQEDRERARQELRDEAMRAGQVVAAKVVAAENRATIQRTELLEKVEEHGRKLAENTQISIDAFREANHVNQKLADIRRSFENIAIRKPIEAAVALEIKKTGDDTNERVKEIEKKL